MTPRPGGGTATDAPAAMAGSPGGAGQHGGILAALAAVPGWWRERAEAAGLTGAWADWRQALPEPPVQVPGDGPPPLLDDPWLLGREYSQALDARTRTNGGRHYTPRMLAETLWGEVRRVLRHRDLGLVMDPAAGCGALLLPALRQYVARAGARAEPERALAQVSAGFAGTDVDPVAAWLGNAVLAAELLPLWAALPERERGPLPRLVTVGDGLVPSDHRPEVVVLNPPYGRVRLDATARGRWRTLWGHANRYQLFLESAIERVRDGGAVGAVLPTSWTGGAYYQRLRGYIASEAPLRRLTWVTDRSDVFTGVLQETCLAVFVKGSRERRVHVSRQVVNGRAHHEPLGQVQLPPHGERAWLLPRTSADVDLVRAAAQLPHRLPDYGWHASTGPLVWNRHKQRIFREPARGRLPIVWASDLDSGEVAPDPRRDGQRWIEIEPEERTHMVLSEPAVLVQRTTAPEQPRRLVVAPLDVSTLERWGGEVVVENHVNVLRCRVDDQALPAPLLVLLLRSQLVDRLYRSISGSVAVSAYELGALPLPDPAQLRAWHDLDAAALEDAALEAYGRA